MIAGLQIRNEFYPITTVLPVSLNYLLADVREPDKRNASYSKTIELNATNEINRLFENIFEVDTVTNSFNPNKKEDVIYYSNGEEVFKGSLQLKQISVNPDGNIVYSCSILGEGGSLFVDIGDKFITGNPDTSDNLDFSAYNHDYSRNNQIASWANAGGSGYYYPFVHRGTNGGNDNTFRVSDFYPCFYLKEYLDKIFEKAGYTYTSDFLNSDFFKKLIVYPNIDKIELSQTQLEDRQFYVGLNSDLPILMASSLYNSNGLSFNLNGTIYAGLSTTVLEYYTPNLPNESTPFFDSGSQYATNTATISDAGYYNIAASDKVRLTLTHTDVDVDIIHLQYLKFFNEIRKSTDGGATYTTIAMNVFDWQPKTISPFYVTDTIVSQFDNGETQNNTVAVATGEIFLNAGDKIQHRIRFENGNAKLFTSLGADITDTSSGTLTFDAKLLSGSTGTSFYMLATKKEVIEGNALNVNNALPKQIKQKDLLKSTIQAFNLYVNADRTNPNELVIEPYNDFYNDGVVDWSRKTDLNKEQIINPTLLEGKQYVFTYKKDTDLYNEKYFNKYGETFGTYKEVIDNDFFKQDKKNELIFAATPNVANYELGIIHPKIFKNELNVVKPHTPIIRLLYAAGEFTAQSPYTYKEQNESDITTTSYGYAGHTDDPLNPTIDLNFGLPKEVYYVYANAYFTTNNLVNAYHLDSLNNTTNRDAKLVTKYLYLTARDINQFSFRKKYFVDGAYYIVNKIMDFDPNEEKSIKVELIKILDPIVFTPESFLIATDPTVESGEGILTALDNSSLRLGNSINLGKNCIAVGDGIVIPADCENVTVIGNNVVIGSGVSDVSIINSNDIEIYDNLSNITIENSSNLTIDTSSVTYINNILSASWNNLYSSFLKITASGGMGYILNMNTTHGTIIGDCSLNTIDCYLPNPSDCITFDSEGLGHSKIFTFKKIDNTANIMTINPNGSELIDGGSFAQLTQQYESISVQTDGTDWFII